MCDVFCIALLLPFVLGFPRSVFLVFFVDFFFSIVFSTCYNLWICFMVWLLSLSFFFYYFLIFNNYFSFFILIILFYLFIFFSFLFSPFYSDPCG